MTKKNTALKASVFSHIRTKYGDSVFSPNAGKYGPE